MMAQKTPTKKDVAEQERQKAIEAIRGYVKRGNTVYTILRSVSKSGMTRHIDVFTFDERGKVYLSGYAAQVLGYRRDREGALVVGGCGMDIGFAVVYNLSACLYGHEDQGGYALRQEWL